MSIPSAQISNDVSIAEIKRTAIDSSGRLGSLYDGCQDRLVGQLSVADQEKLDQSNKIVQGEIKYGDDDQPQNLLRRLSIDEQLRLSILLNLTPSGSITSLIDYPHLINGYTRLFCYSDVNRVQRLPDRIEDAEQFIHSSKPSTKATHIITGIEWGIDLVVILQLPTDVNTVTEIDHVLEKLLSCLLDDNMKYTGTPCEERFLEDIVFTKVYSNIPELNNVTNIRDVCLYIKNNSSTISAYPISYTLRPIKWLYPQDDEKSTTFTPLSVELNEQIEDYILQLSSNMKNFEALVTEDLRRLIDEDLKQRLSDVKDNFTKEITRLSIKVIGIRGGRSDNFVMKQILNQSEQTMMQNSINDLVQILKDLKDKEQLQYSNVAQSASEHTQNEMLTEHQLVVDAEPDQMLDSSDIVLILVASTETDENMDDHMTHVSSTTTQISSPPPTEPQTAVLSSTDVDMSDTSSSPIQVTPPNECEPINILLLGETGVGKSTFINAFANYLTFNTLQQAEKSQPVVLIPVSFLITVGNNFDEHIVKFGDVDDSNNEDFEHPGQSVTQHCKSYVFNLDRNHRQKVCIIDTPGFGDTRGIDQDDYNMAHILEYIRDLSHLDAICFLLKPNQSRLNIFYRSCLTQLSSFRKSNSCANILFCFTNARSTFYTPGDTAPLLRTMLKSLPMADINFKKENTFCFDSESFRYLVALQNGISFDDLQREEYEMSWTKSVSEANRLVHYLCEILSPHRIRDQ